MSHLVFYLYSFMALWSGITIYKTSIAETDKKFGSRMRTACISAIYGLIWPITIIILLVLWLGDRKKNV